MKTVIKLMPVVILGVFLADIFYLEGVSAYNSISTGSKNFVILIYSIYLFLQTLWDKDLIEKSIYINTLPIFWYNAGFFIFSCTEFFFSISYNFVQGQQTSESNMRMIITTLCINCIIGTLSMILQYIGLSKLKKLRYADC
ncbi:hypothetical protein ACDQ55_17280 [Chitinophaga sp. 30R24]|uniref:hypothetical protein n=1 Tax=Chitinophaga sp. 30R24 TaxID=3248838 RepID=UPI003B905CFB